MGASPLLSESLLVGLLGSGQELVEAAVGPSGGEAVEGLHEPAPDVAAVELGGDQASQEDRRRFGALVAAAEDPVGPPDGMRDRLST